MNTQRINALKEIFEQHTQTTHEVEFWYARDLQKLLGYVKWEKFQNVIDKAKIACETSGEDIENHFLHLEKMVKIGSGGNSLDGGYELESCTRGDIENHFVELNKMVKIGSGGNSLSGRYELETRTRGGYIKPFFE